MKTIKTISVSMETWTTAQAKTNNMSGLVEELLNKFIENYKEVEKTPEELKKLVSGHEKTISVLKAEIEKKQKAQKEKKLDLPFDIKRKMESGDFEV